MQQKEPPASRHVRINALDGSGSFNAYLALPASGSGPGLVLAQEIFGVNATMREVADYYAEEGYVVLVPDLFWRQQPDVELGYTPQDWERAFGFYKGFDEALGVQDIQACLNALRQRPDVADGKAGVLGFCLGGKLAYLAACRTDTDAAVGYYGVGIEAALDEAERIRCRSPCMWPNSMPSARPRRASASSRRWALAPAWPCMSTRAWTMPLRARAVTTSTAPRP
jgi:carboxymethylenebutenolidase